MGYTPKEAALLNTPAGLVSLIFVLGAAYGIRVTPNHHRWFWISLCSLVAALGAGLMSFLPTTNKPGLLAGIWLIYAITATLPLVYHYVSVNVSGHTKRSFAANVVAVGFGIGNIIGPQSFQKGDAPEYLPAKIAALATQAGTAVMMVILVLYYRWENGRRNSSSQQGSEGERDRRVGDVGGERKRERATWAGLTDRRNGAWRYVY